MAPHASAAQWPTRLEEVTPEWLADQLQRGGALPSSSSVRRVCALVTCASPTRLTALHLGRRITPSVLPSGPLSCVHRLLVEADDGAQRSVVLKTAPPPDGSGDGARRLASANKHFEREVGFYKCVRGCSVAVCTTCE